MSIKPFNICLIFISRTRTAIHHSALKHAIKKSPSIVWPVCLQQQSFQLYSNDSKVVSFHANIFIASRLNRPAESLGRSLFEIAMTLAVVLFLENCYCRDTSRGRTFFNNIFPLIIFFL